MSTVSKASILLAATLLWGCAPLVDRLGLATDRQIQEWVDENAYGRAIEALEHRPPSPYRRDMLEEIRAQAQAYDEHMARQIQSLREQAKWSRALTLADRAQFNYPDGEAIARAAQRLEQARSHHLDRIQGQLLTSRAEWLLETKPLRQKLAEVDPENPQTQWDAEAVEEDIRRTARRLRDLGIRAMKYGDFAMAERTLEYAQQLRFSEQAAQAQGRLARMQYDDKVREFQQKQRREAQQRRQSAKAREAKAQNRKHELIAQLEKVVRNSELRAAQDLLDKLHAMGANDKHIRELSERVGRAVSARVDKLTEQGNRHYTQGEIEKAKQTWERALELDPGNEWIQSRIARAERVLVRLREIQNSEESGN